MCVCVVWGESRASRHLFQLFFWGGVGGWNKVCGLIILGTRKGWASQRWTTFNKSRIWKMMLPSGKSPIAISKSLKSAMGWQRFVFWLQHCASNIQLRSHDLQTFQDFPSLKVVSEPGSQFLKAHCVCTSYLHIHNHNPEHHKPLLRHFFHKTPQFLGWITPKLGYGSVTLGVLFFSPRFYEFFPTSVKSEARSSISSLGKGYFWLEALEILHQELPTETDGWLENGVYLCDGLCGSL